MTTIKDPLLEPFYIGKDAYCYTVYEVVKPQERYLEEGSAGKDYEKTLGHYNKFNNALLAIIKNKTDLSSPEKVTIKEYLEIYKNIEEELNNLLNSNTL